MKSKKDQNCTSFVARRHDITIYAVSARKLGSGSWRDYGELADHGAAAKELDRQFIRCDMPCKSLLNGNLYYCPRSGHGYDLGMIEGKDGEYVDLLSNSKIRNKRQIRRLM